MSTRGDDAALVAEVSVDVDDAVAAASWLAGLVVVEEACELRANGGWKQPVVCFAAAAGTAVRALAEEHRSKELVPAGPCASLAFRLEQDARLPALAWVWARIFCPSVGILCMAETHRTQLWTVYNLRKLFLSPAAVS